MQLVEALRLLISVVMLLASAPLLLLWRWAQYESPRRAIVIPTTPHTEHESLHVNKRILAVQSPPGTSMHPAILKWVGNLSPVLGAAMRVVWITPNVALAEAAKRSCPDAWLLGSDIVGCLDMRYHERLIVTDDELHRLVVELACPIVVILDNVLPHVKRTSIDADKTFSQLCIHAKRLLTIDSSGRRATSPLVCSNIVFYQTHYLQHTCQFIVDMVSDGRRVYVPCYSDALAQHVCAYVARRIGASKQVMVYTGRKLRMRQRVVPSSVRLVIDTTGDFTSAFDMEGARFDWLVGMMPGDATESDAKRAFEASMAVNGVGNVLLCIADQHSKVPQDMRKFLSLLHRFMDQ